MKIVVTGTRGIPNVIGGVETHCEELFPRIAAMGEDVTVIRRKSYVNDGLKEWKGVSNKTITVLIAGLIVLIFSLVFPNLF